MTPDTDLDRALAAWLTEGPDAFPSHALDATIDQLDRAPQRRLWTFPGKEAPLRMVLSASIAVVIVVAVGAYLLLGTTRDVGTDVPSPSEGTGVPSPSATSSPEATSYTSERNAYTLTLPRGGWDVLEMPADWELGDVFPYPGGDVLRRGGIQRNPTIHIGSQPVPAGTVFDEWLAAYDAAFEPHFPGCTMTSQEQAELGGVTWRYASYASCGDSWLNVEAIAIHNGRAYIIRAAGYDPSLSSQGINLRESLDEWMARLTLDGT